MSDTAHYYLDDFIIDRPLPADTTLSGWATALAGAGTADAAIFTGGGIVWGEDVVATRGEAGWTLSRAIGADAFAVARLPGDCPFRDGNILPERFIDQPTPGEVTIGTIHDGILQWLADREGDLGDFVAIAIGEREPGMTFTFAAHPPLLVRAS